MLFDPILYVIQICYLLVSDIRCTEFSRCLLFLPLTMFHTCSLVNHLIKVVLPSDLCLFIMSCILQYTMFVLLSFIPLKH
jgi:hypothetical protein